MGFERVTPILSPKNEFHALSPDRKWGCPKLERPRLVFETPHSRANPVPPGKIALAYPLLSAQAMKKLHTLCYVVLATIALALASCATQPQTSTTSNSSSPMERQNGNGLASAMH